MLKAIEEEGVLKHFKNILQEPNTSDVLLEKVSSETDLVVCVCMHVCCMCVCAWVCMHLKTFTSYM